jgi:patatin-like phospholipase/acyl hydrolase
MSWEGTNSEFFYVLAIDGGGIRGIYAAHILRRLKDEYAIQFPQRFDLIAGTSTGSIIASALATETSIDEVVHLYEREGRRVFSRRLSGSGFLRSMYSKANLAAVLRNVFGTKTLSAARTRLVIPATDISNGCVHVFKSPYDPSFVRDRDVPLVSAILASCSAPIYFDPEVVDEYLTADGGLWANNPVLVAIVEATGKLGVPRDRVRVLSIGTGGGHQRYSPAAAGLTGWGMVRWGPRRLVDLILALQSAAADNMTQVLVPSANRMRLDFQLDGDLRLDNVKSIMDLKARADRDFTHRSSKLRAFLGL